MGNAPSVRPEGYQLTNLNGGESTFTFGRLPAFAAAIFEYDEFLQATTTPAEYGAPNSFVIDGFPNSFFPLDCFEGCFGINNQQTVTYNGPLGLGNGGVIAGNLNLNNVAFTGSGTINGNLALGGTSTFGPGSSPGQIVVNGNMTLGPNSVSRFEFAGNGQQPGIDYDFLRVTGTLTRGGRLELVDISGGALRVPQSFRFIEAGAFAGQFAELARLSPAILFSAPVDGTLPNGVRTMTVAANAGTQANSSTGTTLTQTQLPPPPPPLPGQDQPPPPPPGSNTQPTQQDEEEAKQAAATGTQGETPTQQTQNMQVKRTKTGTKRPSTCQ